MKENVSFSRIQVSIHQILYIKHIHIRVYTSDRSKPGSCVCSTDKHHAVDEQPVDSRRTKTWNTSNDEMMTLL